MEGIACAIVGLFVGAIIGVFAAGLRMTAKSSDEPIASGVDWEDGRQPDPAEGPAPGLRGFEGRVRDLHG